MDDDVIILEQPMTSDENRQKEGKRRSLSTSNDPHGTDSDAPQTKAGRFSVDRK